MQHTQGRNQLEEVKKVILRLQFFSDFDLHSTLLTEFSDQKLLKLT